MENVCFYNGILENNPMKLYIHNDCLKIIYDDIKIENKIISFKEIITFAINNKENILTIEYGNEENSQYLLITLDKKTKGKY